MNDDNRGKFLRRELTLGLQLASKLQNIAEIRFNNESSRRTRHIKGFSFTNEGIEINYEFHAGCGDYESDTQFYNLEELITSAENQQ